MSHVTDLMDPPVIPTEKEKTTTKNSRRPREAMATGGIDSILVALPYSAALVGEDAVAGEALVAVAGEAWSPEKTPSQLFYFGGRPRRSAVFCGRRRRRRPHSFPVSQAKALPTTALRSKLRPETSPATVENH